MTMEYTTPAGEYSRLYSAMLSDTHLLIAGATGSGKSTVINGIIHAALYNSPAKIRFIFIDPKGTELDEYKSLPHCIQYAQTMPDCVKALEMALEITRTRFAEMKRKKARMYDGSDIYVIIDELMYFMNQAAVKKRAMSLLQDILVIARAARVHVIACTQNCTVQTLPATLRCNFDSRLGLRTSTAQDSRNVLGVNGCETLPDPKREGKAFGYYRQGAETSLYRLQKVEEAEINRLIAHWMDRRNTRRTFSLFGRKSA